MGPTPHPSLPTPLGDSYSKIGPFNAVYSIFSSHFHVPFLTQNTVTNADKLLAASEELSHTGECNPEEIYQVAHELEDRMQKFLARVEKRQQLLDLSVSFHAHTQEILAW